MFGIQEKNPQKWVYIDNTGKMRLVSARCFFMGKREGNEGDFTTKSKNADFEEESWSG